MRNGVFRSYRAPVIALAALSAIGALSLRFGDKSWLQAVLDDRWSPSYLLLSPFLHGSVAHLLLNVMGLHYIGGMMLLPIIGARRFVALFAVGAGAGVVVNNLMTETPAIGISAAVMGMLACALHPFGRAPMRLLLLHDLLRLPPFSLRSLAAFVVVLDVAGIVFGWGIFAHWAHLGGFAAGGALGFFFFRRPPGGWRRRIGIFRR